MAVVSYLNVTLQVGGHKRFERATERETEIVREKDGSIDYNRMENTQSAKVIFEPVSDENCLRMDKAKKITLDIAHGFGGLLQVLFAEAGKTGVVVNHSTLRFHQRFVNKAAVDADDRHLANFEAASRVAHFAVQGVHRVAAGASAWSGADVVGKRAVHSRADAVPNVKVACRTSDGTFASLATGFRMANRIASTGPNDTYIFLPLDIRHPA